MRCCRVGKKDAIFLVLILVIGLSAGVVGAALSAQIFTKPGPEGPQGIPGVNGTDSISQILQNRNGTQVDISNYTEMQWHNFSNFDSSMEMAINVRQNSKIFAQFSGTHTLQPPASIWIRIVVDNNYNSSRYVCSLGSTVRGAHTNTGHMRARGVLYVSADYWEPKIHVNTSIRIFGLRWKIFSKKEIVSLINLAEEFDLKLENSEIPPTGKEVQFWSGNYFTYISCVFKKIS